MSTTFGRLTEYQLRWFDETIHAVGWQQTKFLNWFMGFPGTKTVRGSLNSVNLNGGLIRSVEEGMEEVVTTKWEQMKPGAIGASLQEAPKQYIKLTQESQPLMYLTTKLVFPVNQVDAWRHNKFIAGGDLIPQALRQVMFPLTNQIDQFICYGMDMKTPLHFDRLTGGAKFTGLFNGFTSFSAGTGTDDDIGAKGDIFSTYVNARHNLVANTFDTGPYYILSDETTKSNMEKGNLLYTTGTKPISEYTAFMGEYKDKRKEVAEWIDSINAFPGSNTSQYRWCLTQPYISQQGQGIEPAYCMYVGYNFKVWPLYGGGLNGNAEYEFLVATSLRLHSFNDKALYHSGTTSAALTFTG